MTALRAGAIAIAVLSGMCALITLAVGSPLQFGASLAVCGAGWIAADFIEWTNAHAPRVCAIPVTRRNRGYGPNHVVFVGGSEYLPAPTLSVETPLAA
jgi:hypothetical protein